MSINVLERVREIGVVRAVGASDMAVLRLILVEGVIIGLLSWLTGTIVSLPVSLLITNVLGISMMQRPLTYSFSFTGALMWLAIAIILAAVASFLPARGASRLTVREVLAYE
jgi:putative ABC transport system permease protein